MTHGELFIKRLSTWAPGLGSRGEWDEWAEGKRQMLGGSGSPEIAFTEPLFRRRLSQISKMTIQVVHDLFPVGENTKMLFLSFRGELSKQYKINKMQIEDGTITPAVFSFSVFNAPVALAAMALGLKGGYSAIYPRENSFRDGLKSANAALFSGAEDELIFVYADEEIPPEYTPLLSGHSPPFAFALLLSRKSGDVPFSSINETKETPLDFLKSLLLREGIHACL